LLHRLDDGLPPGLQSRFGLASLLLFLLRRPVHHQLADRHDLHLPLPPGEVVLENALIDIHPIQSGMPSGTADRQPQFMQPGSELERLAAVDQEPLTGELGEPRLRQVFQFQRLERPSRRFR